MIVDHYLSERVAQRAMTTIATGFTVSASGVNPWYRWFILALITPERVKQTKSGIIVFVLIPVMHSGLKGQLIPSASGRK